MNFPSQTVERHNKPEIEVMTSPELVLLPVKICRSEYDVVFVEPSINSVRVSIGFNKSDETEVIISRRYMRFLAQRAETFKIVRREPIKPYDISFLITNLEIEELYRDRLIGFIIEFMNEIDKDIMQMKIDFNARARTVTRTYLSSLQFTGN